MNVVPFVPGDPVPAEHYNGIQQELYGVIQALGAHYGNGGYLGDPTNNATVQEQSPQSPSGVLVKGPATFWVAPLLTGGGTPFVKTGDENLAVPALNTTAGQSRNDLVVARVNLGLTNAYTYEVVQGTPATTGSQTDPASLPTNSIVLARITRAHGAGNITNAMITDMRPRAGGSAGALVASVVSGGWIALSSSGTLTANEARGQRVTIPVTGRLRDIAAYVVTASGNYDVGVLNVAGPTRTFLYRKGSTAVPASGAWRVLGDPNIQVYAGQQLDLVVAFDNATASLGRDVSLSATAVADLPPGFLTPPELTSPGQNLLTWTRATSFPLPSTVADSGLAGVTVIPTLIARVQ